MSNDQVLSSSNIILNKKLAWFNYYYYNITYYIIYFNIYQLCLSIFKILFLLQIKVPISKLIEYILYIYGKKDEGKKYVLYVYSRRVFDVFVQVKAML